MLTETVVSDTIDRDLFRRIQDRVAVVGIGHLPFAKDIGRPISDTAVEAIQLALHDAGLEAEDLDAGVGGGFDDGADDGVQAWGIATPGEHSDFFQQGHEWGTDASQRGATHADSEYSCSLPGSGTCFRNVVEATFAWIVSEGACQP